MSKTKHERAFALNDVEMRMQGKLMAAISNACDLTQKYTQKPPYDKISVKMEELGLFDISYWLAIELKKAGLIVIDTRKK